MKKFSQVAGAVGAALLPVLAFAQTQFNSVDSAFGVIFRVINSYLIPLAFALAILYFLWGILKFVTAGGDEEKRNEGRNVMVYGVIAIFVMTAVWGLVGILRNSTGISDTNVPPLPEIPVRR